MASCPAPAPGCKGCVNQLAVMANGGERIMPQPEFCQEAAFVGMILDHLAARPMP